MLDSLCRKTRAGGPAGRPAPLRGLTVAVVVAGCLLSPLLLAGCSQGTATPSRELRAATTTAHPADPTVTPTPDTPPEPVATPSPPPADVPAREPSLAPTQQVPFPTPEQAPAVEEPASPPPAVVADDNAAFVSRVIDLVNAARRQEGVQPLSPASCLMDAAQRQALAMAGAGRLTHTDPDGSTMEGRVQAAGYGGWTALGEVLAAGLDSPEAVVAYWLASPEHRARLLDPTYKELGAGYYYLSNSTYGHWWAVDLGAR